MKSSGPDDSLARTLAAWRLAPPRDPGFRLAVRAKLAAARQPATWGNFARTHIGALAAALAVATLVGGWAGRERARSAVEADREAIAKVYVQALDARAMWRP